MWECRRYKRPGLAGLVAGALATTAYAQDTGIVRGAVTFAASGERVHGTVVLVVGPSLVVLTDADGVFEIPDVPAGTYEVLAQREHLTAARQTVTAWGMVPRFAGSPVLPAPSARHLAPVRASGIFVARFFA